MKEKINLYVDDVRDCPASFTIARNVHTDNGVGRENMYHTLKGAQRRGFINKDIQIFHYSITQNKYS